MSTKIDFDETARKHLKEGVDQVANTVKATLGAEGMNVIIPALNGSYMITKDGVSIAKSIFPEGHVQAIGASLIKEAASRTNVQAGDGTTTATVIAQLIFDAGLRVMATNKNCSSIELKKGIDAATKDVVAYLNNITQKVSKQNLESVATISANGDQELGEIISQAFNKIGEHGTVISAVSDTSDTYIELREGVQLNRGFYHNSFITDPIKDLCELHNPFVLLHKGKIEKGDPIVDLFDNVFSQPDNRNLLIVTDDIDPFVLSVINENITKGPIRGRICVVKTPQILKIEKDLLVDLATLTGATIVSDHSGVKLNPKALGVIDKCIVSATETIIVGDANNLTETIVILKEKIKRQKNKYEKEELQERLSRITGGVATLYVGAKSDSELAEKQARVEDSINATRSALEEGIVPGGGIALENAANFLSRHLPELKPLTFWDKLFRRTKEHHSFDHGYNIALTACRFPAIQICQNAGLTWHRWADGVGVNVKTGDTVNMVEEGIIDPTKVTRCALENAASVASTFLTTSAVVARQ